MSFIRSPVKSEIRLRFPMRVLTLKLSSLRRASHECLSHLRFRPAVPCDSRPLAYSRNAPVTDDAHPIAPLARIRSICNVSDRGHFILDAASGRSSFRMTAIASMTRMCRGWPCSATMTISSRRPHPSARQAGSRSLLPSRCRLPARCPLGTIRACRRRSFQVPASEHRSASFRVVFVLTRSVDDQTDPPMLCSFASTASSAKVPGLWRGGYST